MLITCTVGAFEGWNGSQDLKRLLMRFVCFILLGFGTSTKDPIQSLDWFYILFLLLPPMFSRLDVFSWFFHRLDAKTLLKIKVFSAYQIGSCVTHCSTDSIPWDHHSRDEGPLDYDEGFVCLQVQTNFAMIIKRQQILMSAPSRVLGLMLLALSPKGLLTNKRMVIRPLEPYLPIGL